MASSRELKVTVTRYIMKPKCDEQTGYRIDSNACRAFEQRAARFANSGLQVISLTHSKFITYNHDTQEIQMLQIEPDVSRPVIYCDERKRGGFKTGLFVDTAWQEQFTKFMREAAGYDLFGKDKSSTAIYKHRSGCNCRNRGGRP